MTRKADFTRYEWAQLKETVEMVGLSMLVESRGGPLGKLRELATLSSCLTIDKLPIQFKRNELVLAVLEDIRVEPAGPQAYLSHGDLVGLLAGMVTARLNVLNYCERVAVLLAAKSPMSEAEGVKRWLLWIARSVAEASGDRPLRHGRNLSGAQSRMLNLIADGLGTTVVVAVPTASELEAMLGLAPGDADGISGSGESSKQRQSSAE